MIINRNEIFEKYIIIFYFDIYGSPYVIIQSVQNIDKTFKFDLVVQYCGHF
jgi:hypothetical protein